MADLSAFRDVIKFEIPSKTMNVSGGHAEQYSYFCTTRAMVTKKDGYREFKDGYDAIINVYEIICHWRMSLENNIDKDTRLIYNDRNLRIETWEVEGEYPYYIKIKASEII